MSTEPDDLALPSMLDAMTLDALLQDADAAARLALAEYPDDAWADPIFASSLLSVTRSLRAAGRSPTEPMLEAMERCTAAIFAQRFAPRSP